MKTAITAILLALLTACTPAPRAAAPSNSPKPYDTSGRDDSDPPNGKSGMWVLIDHRTGCHYLGWDGSYGRSAALVPRMDKNGDQVCK